MGPGLGFSLDQLMELAGLSVAHAVHEEYPTDPSAPGGPLRVLVVAGPGNNGGDGLVAARHLHHWGYRCAVVYPKQPPAKPLFQGLLTQLTSLGIPFVEPDAVVAAAQTSGGLGSHYDVVVDAVFGFSFSGGPLRPPWDRLLAALRPPPQSNAVDAASGKRRLPYIVSVDVPSGWHVELGDVGGVSGLRPDMLVSLTAPKLCAQHFTGSHHYLGGRFVPPAIAQRFDLRLPSYPGTSQVVKLNPSTPRPDVSELKVQDMRITYTRGELDDSEVGAYGEPLGLWDAWFKEAVASKVCEEPNAIALATADGAGRPAVRMVLLKGYDARGFVFYTNYSSRKGSDLAANGHAAFTVFWEGLQRSVRVEGLVEKVPDAESDEYFGSRPRGSQLGAWVSAQSSVIRGRQELEERAEALKAQYADEAVPVPRPPHWGGYLVVPLAVEFWQGRPSRLHDRIRFSRNDRHSSEWVKHRLSP